MDFSPASRKEPRLDSGDCDIDSSHCGSRAKASHSTQQKGGFGACARVGKGCVNVAVIAFLFVCFFVFLFEEDMES